MSGGKDNMNKRGKDKVTRAVRARHPVRRVPSPRHPARASPRRPHHPAPRLWRTVAAALKAVAEYREASVSLCERIVKHPERIEGLIPV